MSNIKDKIIHEVKKTFLVTAYFAVGLNLLVIIAVLISDKIDFKIGYIGAATFSAALTGKVVVILESVGIDLKLKRTKLLNIVMMKSILYTVVIFLTILVEDVLKGMISDDLSFSEVIKHIIHSFESDFFLGRAIYMFVLFGMYHFIFEVDKFLGATELFDMVFSRFYEPKEKEFVVMHVRWEFTTDQLLEKMEEMQQFSYLLNQSLFKHKGMIDRYDLDGVYCVWENSPSDKYEKHAEDFFKNLEELEDKCKVSNIRAAYTTDRIDLAEVGGFLKKEILRVGDAFNKVEEATKPSAGIPLRKVS
ncbi:hypothetical protein KMW28_08345 [Flammeovirga yaeyamensis]|uniref:Uncharacterized protein n=1 Tax=Flammeovirga yaeyamensis TaxID=367791 RepID=A0AAX1ND36_9BACT|nr:hypothetical protein [Flammeovirga yaeyamensis]MBB3699030.1 hypothetical protein [Flammeovirga yaeyamensis]NMF36464.1 hypothetical protein [Flammeovirga yaeyamensis]QWG03578.1 hypothetical protein KMW28_08345 [Flammeovirga yaeyamensis]